MAVDRNRKLVWHEKTSINFEYDTLDEAIDKLQSHRADYYGGDTRIEERHHQYSDGTYLAIMVKEPETDLEMTKRIAQEEHYAAQQEERDRQDYERLQKKFGKG
jgi:ABC-type amino acid transport substrate-binding protein